MSSSYYSHRAPPGQGGPRSQDVGDDLPDLAPSILDRPPDCINRNPTPSFYLLCDIMGRLRRFDPAKRRVTLERFFDLWRAKVGPDLYPVIRLLLPDRDRERPVYKLKEALLARCYIEVLGLKRDSEDAQRLIKWKQPAVEGQNNSGSGDFARQCFNAISARSTVQDGQLSIEAVNKLLDRLAFGGSKQSDIVPILRTIHQQSTPLEQEWIIRIILKDLRIQVREKGIFGCFHPDAADLFNVCSDLKRVCWTLYKPDIRLQKHETNVELFRSFLPQLCHRYSTTSHKDIATIARDATTKDFIMEEKLDGERMQLHMRGNGAQWFYCSRKAKDYTYLYGAHIGEGSLTPYIAGAFQAGVENVILDGEMVVWDPVLEKYLPFGGLKTAALAHANDEDAPRPCFKVFDILYLNGTVLTRRFLKKRKELLHDGRVFKDNLRDYQGRLEFAEERVGKTGKDIGDFLEKILDARGEGLVVKKNEALYETNSRGADWIKVKPEYSDEMGEEFELLVLGGWWGKGGRTGKLSSLLCGLREQKDDDKSGKTPSFITFCSVGSGFSLGDYNWMMEKHKADLKLFDRHRPPAFMKLGHSGIDDKPDVYIEPEKSFVIKVKASEVVPAGGGYGAGYTLRFPRCKYLYWDRNSREYPVSDADGDKDMWNCLSFEEFDKLLSEPKKRYSDTQGGTKKKRRKPAQSRKVQLLGSFKGQDLSDEHVEGSVFDGIVFYIPKGTAKHSKADLEALVHKFGGDYTQAQLADLSAYVISPDEKGPHVRAQIRKGVTVIKPEWVFESIKREEALPLIKDLLVYASEETTNDKDYTKTLDELDRPSIAEEEEEEAEEDDEDEEDDKERQSADDEKKQRAEAEEKKRAEEEEKRKTAGQLKIETEWELRGSNAPSESSVDTSQRLEIEDSDTDVENDADDQAGDSDDDEPEDHHRLWSVRGVDHTPEEGMGDDPAAMKYDEEKIFTHLVFYIDTSENAHENGLQTSEQTGEVTSSLAQAEALLTNYGGRITTNVDDKKLTHIIMDNDDSTRYAELSRRTAKPKRKHIVTPSWVKSCVDEDTLMQEDDHKPT
ncbi:hypothetical protein IAT38_002982 [Cryptococcus sp. DSM 104549]